MYEAFFFLFNASGGSLEADTIVVFKIHLNRHMYKLGME